MKKHIIFFILAASTSLNAQSFVAGWDFDGVNAAATSVTANWGDQTGSAIASWTHSPANPPISFTPEFGISANNNDDSINDSFNFLATGKDENDGFFAFSENFNNTGEFGFQSLTANDTFSIGFNGSNWTGLQLAYAFASDQGEAFSVQTIDLGAFDGVASAQYDFTPSLNGVYDNFAITGTVVPEPSTYAVIFGALALAFVVYRRRR